MSTPRDMDALFGEARSLIAASEEPFVMSEELRDLLLEAHGLDPRRYAEEWVPYLASLDCWSRQGFAFSDLKGFARWYRVLPFMDLAFHPYEIVDDADPMEGFAQNPVVRHILAIDLQDYMCTPEAVAELLAAPLDALSELTCGWNFSDDDEVASLTSAPWAPGLRALKHWNGHPSYRGFEALFTSGRFTSLEELSYGGDLSAEGLTARARASFPSLRVLSLGETNMSLGMLDTLLDAGVFEGVRELNLSGNAFDERGVRALASSSSVRALESLDVRGVHLGEHTVEMLEHRIPRHLPNLSRLVVEPGGVDREWLEHWPLVKSRLRFFR